MKNFIIVISLFFTLSGFCQNFVSNNEESVSTVVADEVNSQQVTAIKDIYFDNNKSILNNESIDSLETILNVLLENPEMKISINSFADKNETFNKISKNRANAVKDYLVKNGVASKRLIIKDFGKSKQLSDSDSDKFERRVEFQIEL
jgi:outer membrane protein OmpA-like peptidoglycan-associated protein